MIDHDFHAHDNEKDKALWNSLKPADFNPLSTMMDDFRKDIAYGLGIPMKMLFRENKEWLLDGPVGIEYQKRVENTQKLLEVASQRAINMCQVYLCKRLFKNRKNRRPRFARCV